MVDECFPSSSSARLSQRDMPRGAAILYSGARSCRFNEQAYIRRRPSFRRVRRDRPSPDGLPAGVQRSHQLRQGSCNPFGSPEACARSKRERVHPPVRACAQCLLFLTCFITMARAQRLSMPSPRCPIPDGTCCASPLYPICRSARSHLPLLADAPLKPMARHDTNRNGRRRDDRCVRNGKAAEAEAPGLSFREKRGHRTANLVGTGDMSSTASSRPTPDDVRHFPHEMAVWGTADGHGEQSGSPTFRRNRVNSCASLPTAAPPSTEQSVGAVSRLRRR